MRNQEAARYARWAAIAAGVLALLVVLIFARREFREMRARRAAPPAIPSAVQQQSAEFSYSDVEQGHTIFTIRASHATQFKDANRAVLEDVWITMYGRKGDRNDNIHTRECSYEPGNGGVRCQGDVQIDIQPSAASSKAPNQRSLQIVTSDISFNRNSGEASTSSPLEFHFAGGNGHAVGVTYSANDETVRVGGPVHFEMAASNETGGMPVAASGSGLEVQRENRTAVLKGPANVSQGARNLSAQQISFLLDDTYHVQGIHVEGNPSIEGTESGTQFAISADRFDGKLTAVGWVQQVIADGNVKGSRQSSAGTDNFQASHVEIAMRDHNLLNEMTASGGFTGTSQQRNGSRVLKTDALRIVFALGAASSPEKQPIQTVESLAPATLQSSAGNESTQLKAQKVLAQFGANSRLEKLTGHSGVEVRRQVGSAPPQISTATDLVAMFASNGDWNTLDETGNVRFQEADRSASATHATFNRASDIITLDGSPELSDAMSHTTAGSVTINQKSGDLRATGGIVSTLSGQQATAVNFGAGAAHISGDSLTGSTTSGHVVYAGHARLWQGDTILNADQIELWRDDKKLQATGHIVAAFAQGANSLVPSFSDISKASPAPTKTPGKSQPVLWTVRSQSLSYLDPEGRVHLDGGVNASSQQGSLTSKTLDVYLGPAAAAPGKPATPAGERQLNRMVAQGNVVIRQGDRRGMADQAEYTAADQKFVLSGGKPSLQDDVSGDTTTGRSLTFYVANDTILIDSQEGSRTVTRHRIEK